MKNDFAAVEESHLWDTGNQQADYNAWSFSLAEKGGSYRTIQLLYHSELSWEAIHWLLFRLKFLILSNEYNAADEVVASKAGKETHRLDRFFYGSQQRVNSGCHFLPFRR